jgi:hypothetical protein
MKLSYTVRFSSVEGEEDQNAALLVFNMFNKDNKCEHYKIQNNKCEKTETVLSGAMTQRQKTYTNYLERKQPRKHTEPLGQTKHMNPPCHTLT